MGFFKHFKVILYHQILTLILSIIIILKNMFIISEYLCKINYYLQLLSHLLTKFCYYKNLRLLGQLFNYFQKYDY